MKKLILISVLLFCCNAMAEEYNVVCRNGYYGVVIRNVEDIELAKEIVKELHGACYCTIIKVRN